MLRRSVVRAAVGLALTALATAALAGCASARAESAARADTRPVRPSLVSGGGEATGLIAENLPRAGVRGDWEFNRNDRLLGLPGLARRPDVAAVSVHSRDRLWTIDGRPHETSSTTTNSVRIRISP